jgi:4-amino-4-deoxy-L-arabinose transferase-like glycosyltransferase
MGWGVMTYIFGAICIVGPFLLMYWYAKAARKKFKDFNAAAAEGRAEEESPAGPGEGS